MDGRSLGRMKSPRRTRTDVLESKGTALLGRPDSQQLAACDFRGSASSPIGLHSQRTGARQVVTGCAGFLHETAQHLQLLVSIGKTRPWLLCGLTWNPQGGPGGIPATLKYGVFSELLSSLLIWRSLYLGIGPPKTTKHDKGFLFFPFHTN